MSHLGAAVLKWVSPEWAQDTESLVQRKGVSGMRTLTEHAQKKFHVCSLFLIDLITVSLSWRNAGGRY